VFGDVMFIVSSIVLLFTLSGSPFLTTTLYAVELIPNILFGPLFAPYVDRKKKYKIISSMEILRAIGIVILIPFLLLLDNYYFIFLIVFLSSFCFAISYPARRSLISMIVNEDYIQKANAKIGTLNQLIQLVSYGISPVLLIIIGPVTTMLIFPFALIISSLLVYSIKKKEINRTLTSVLRETREKIYYLKELKIGISWVKENSVVKYLIIASIPLNFFYAFTITLPVIYVTESLHLGSALFPVLTTTSFVGGAIGSLSIGLYKTKRVGTILVLSIAVVGLSILFTGSVHSFILTIIFFFILGASSAVYNVQYISLLQSMVPLDIMGRVFTFDNSMSNIATPVAMVLSGLLSTLIGVNLAFSVAGVGIIIISFALALMKKIRKYTYPINQSEMVSTIP
jgi:MFS family permease